MKVSHNGSTAMSNVQRNIDVVEEVESSREEGGRSPTMQVSHNGSIQLSNLQRNIEIAEHVESSRERGGCPPTATSSTGIWPTQDQLIELHCHEPAIVYPKWDLIFMLSCALAVLVDPFSLYLGRIIIGDENLWYYQNSTLEWWVYIFLRSATDFIYLVDLMVIRARTRSLKLVSGSSGAAFIHAFRIFLFVPIPQILLFTPLPLWFELFHVMQYSARVYSIYSSLKRLPNTEIRRGRFLIAIFDLLPYVLAAHLLGALWYTLAGERLLSCWSSALHKFCDSDAYMNNKEMCDYHQGNSYNLTCEPGPNRCFPSFNATLFLEEWCPIVSPSATVFDFGIYLYGLQSHIVTSKSTSKMMLQCFWWGLRNMSSFGSNLQTSLDWLETIFAVVVSLTGMSLFFIYFNARVQASQKRSSQLILGRKMKMMIPHIDWWLSKNSLPKDLKITIMKNMRQNFQENKDVDVQILYVLPLLLRRSVIYTFCSASLRKVPMLREIHEQVLKAICERLKPIVYTEGNYIIQEGQPLEKMLFITQGTAWTYTTNNDGRNVSSSSVIQCLEKGDFCGEDILNWASKLSPFSEFPNSARMVKSETKVEAFAISARDLKSVVVKYRWHFRNNPEWEQREHLAAYCIQANRRRHRDRARGGQDGLEVATGDHL